MRLVWLLFGLNLALSASAWWSLKAFVAQHPAIAGEGDLAAFAAMAKRQMWLSLGLMAVLVSMCLATFRVGLQPQVSFVWLAAALLSVGLMPVLHHAQERSRTLPCADEDLKARREHIIRVWKGVLFPPRNLGAPIVESTSPANLERAGGGPPNAGSLAQDAQDPRPPAGGGSQFTRIAATCTAFFVLMYYTTAAAGPDMVVAYVPFSMGLRLLGPFATAPLLALAVLMHRHNRLASVGLLVAFAVDRTAWLPLVASAGPPAILIAWSATMLLLTLLFALGALGAFRAHRRVALAAP